MKKVRRVIALLLAIIMLVSMSSTFTFAAGSKSYTHRTLKTVYYDKAIAINGDGTNTNRNHNSRKVMYSLVKYTYQKQRAGTTSWQTINHKYKYEIKFWKTRYDSNYPQYNNYVWTPAKTITGQIIERTTTESRIETMKALDSDFYIRIHNGLWHGVFHKLYWYCCDCY